MSKSVFTPQMGFIPSGANQDSRVIVGQNPNVTWEAIGFGQRGRPDTLQQFEIFLTAISGDQTSVLTSGPLMATILMDCSSMYNTIANNPTAPTTGFFFSMREVSVCENVAGNSVERKMMILASQTYPTGVGGS